MDLRFVPRTQDHVGEEDPPLLSYDLPAVFSAKRK